MSIIILLCRVKTLDNEMGKAWFSFYSNSVSRVVYVTHMH